MDEILIKLSELKRITLLGAKNVLNIDDVAFLYGFSKSTIYKMTSAREIPHYRRGKLLFFDKAELDEWAKQNRIQTLEECEQNAIAYCHKN